jgi:hypothetical protein
LISKVTYGGKNTPPISPLFRINEPSQQNVAAEFLDAIRELATTRGDDQLLEVTFFNTSSFVHSVFSVVRPI